ncbi:uncharacterized protein [Typha angustifolia]|uniref:uncharacterized protein n=1 Tax=Typha angustifolia TaxID=59011 RepID=UPI003C2BBE0E
MSSILEDTTTIINMASCNGSNNNTGASLPLLLNPVYARSKSTLYDDLRHFRLCLRFCFLDHSTALARAISYLFFALFTVIIPVLISLTLQTSSITIFFDKLTQLSESSLAFISFFTLAVFFRRHGLRQLLFLDGALRDDSPFVRRAYSRELDRAFRHLTCILLPSFAVELSHKVLLYFFSSTITITIPLPVPLRLPHVPWSTVAFAVTVASWVYRTGVFLLVCVLFRLTCLLQILRFEVLYKMFDGEEEGGGGGGGDQRNIELAEKMFDEHMRIKRQLLATSHRYRIFILGSLVTITISQLGALMMVLSSKSNKNFRNSGDLLVCSAVQLSGFFMCLLGAARITHRAQGVVSIASRWHMTMSCPGRSSTPPAAAANGGNVEPSSEFDDASNFPKASAFVSSSPQHTSSAFGSRQALVTYLQHNGGGITLFGFPLDRGLLHTIFVFEMTLVLWILSKVVVLP